MIGIPYIVKVLTAILKQSKSIEGRFYVSTKWGSGISAGALENLEELVDIGEKNPLRTLAVMMPPRVSTRSRHDKPARKSYEIIILFLSQAGTDKDGEVRQPRTDIPSKSEHLTIHDWHDMERVALDFLRVLDKVIFESTSGNYISIDPRQDETVEFITTIGKAKYNGAKLTMSISLGTECTISDYQDDYMNNIVLPNGDSHPFH